MLAVYTCPVLVRAAHEPSYEAFAALDRRIAAALEETPPAGLVRATRTLEAPARWPAHVGAVAGGTAKPTLSVWADLGSAFAYAYGPGPHREALRRRRDWFALVSQPIYVLWHVPCAAAATHDAAVERLERLQREGPTPAAFDFRHPFDPNGRPLDPAGRGLPDGRSDAPDSPGDRQRQGQRGPLPLPLRDHGR